jgi:hypothetical protein
MENLKISRAVSCKKYDWHVARINDKGEVSEE